MSRTPARKVYAADDDSPYTPGSPQRIRDDEAMTEARRLSVPCQEDRHDDCLPNINGCQDRCHASAPVQITREEFLVDLARQMGMWLPREPRTRSSWWLYVQEIAAARFNEAYARDFPPRTR